MEDAVRDRTSRLAHYIISSVKSHELGKTKLFKIMWFADVFHYRRYGASISGLEAYVRMPKGPVPKDIYPILRGLKDAGVLLERDANAGQSVRHELIAITKADPAKFCGTEIDSIHRAINLIRPLSAQEASELTHDALWECLKDYQLMPVAAAAVIPGDVTPEDIQIMAMDEDFADVNPADDRLYR